MRRGSKTRLFWPFWGGFDPTSNGHQRPPWCRRMALMGSLIGYETWSTRWSHACTNVMHFRTTLSDRMGVCLCHIGKDAKIALKLSWTHEKWSLWGGLGLNTSSHILHSITVHHATGLDARSQRCSSILVAETVDSLIPSRIFDKKISCSNGFLGAGCTPLLVFFLKTCRGFSSHFF